MNARRFSRTAAATEVPSQPSRANSPTEYLVVLLATPPANDRGHQYLPAGVNNAP